MDKINKEHIIAGVIGGVVALGLSYASKKYLFKSCSKSKTGSAVGRLVTMNSDKMPAAIGPYTKGKMVDFGNGQYLAWSSGQLGLDPNTNELISDNVEEQAERVILNLKALAESNGFTLKDTVKNVVYLIDMNDFARVNEVYKRYYPSDFPARTCIAIKALPKGGKVEIESVFFKAS